MSNFTHVTQETLLILQNYILLLCIELSAKSFFRRRSMEVKLLQYQLRSMSITRYYGHFECRSDCLSLFQHVLVLCCYLISDITHCCQINNKLIIRINLHYTGRENAGININRVVTYRLCSIKKFPFPLSLFQISGRLWRQNCALFLGSCHKCNETVSLADTAVSLHTFQLQWVGGGYSLLLKTQSAKFWPTFHFQGGIGGFLAIGFIGKMNQIFCKPNLLLYCR